MNNQSKVLWEAMETFFAYHPHLHATLTEIDVPRDTPFVLTPHTQESVSDMVDLLTSFANDGDMEHMAKFVIGAIETAKFATQMAAFLAKVDYRAMEKKCNNNYSCNFKPLITENP